MTNATRQAAWRQRQKDAGASGRSHSLKGLTLAELTHLRKCLATYRGVTPVTPEPVASMGGLFDQSWLAKLRAEAADREREKQAAWDALTPGQKIEKAQRDAKNKVRAQKAAETRRRNQPYAKSTFERYTLEGLRIIRRDNHPDRNGSGDLKLYQLAVEEIDRRSALRRNSSTKETT